MIRAGIVGATGYTGAELTRILLQHPRVEVVQVTSRSYSDQRLDQVFPSLSGQTDLICRTLNIEDLNKKVDVIFICLPHGHSAEVAEAAYKKGIVVIDLGADFRLKSAKTYEKWYQSVAPESQLLERAVYGLPELYRDKIRDTKLVANPGCYPTSSILALAPVLKQGVIDPEGIIIDAKSGVSGAGRSVSLGTHFAEVNESFKAYKVASHRHIPEIEQELANLVTKEVTISFTPHLVPINRGLLVTAYANLNGDHSQDSIRQLYSDFYQQEKFVSLLPEGKLPQTNWVSGTNNCQLGITVDQRTNRLIVVAAIDNLVKGAAGQAVQNMNIMFGNQETEGLNLISRYL